MLILLHLNDFGRGWLDFIEKDRVPVQCSGNQIAFTMPLFTITSPAACIVSLKTSIAVLSYKYTTNDLVADYGNNNKAQSDIVSVEESYNDKIRKRTEGRKQVTDMAQSVAKLNGGNVQ